MVRWVTIPSSPPEETAAQRHKSLEVPQDTLKGILMGNKGQNWRVSGDWGSYGAFSQAEFELTAEYPSGSALKQLTPRSRI